MLKRLLIDPFKPYKLLEKLKKKLEERDDHGRPKMPLLIRAAANDFYDLFDKGLLGWAESRDTENKFLIWLDNRPGFQKIYAKPLRIALNAVHLVTLRIPAAILRGPIVAVTDAVFLDRWKRTKKYLGMKGEKAELKQSRFGFIRKFGSSVDEWPWEARRSTEVAYNVLHRLTFNNVTKMALGYLVGSGAGSLLTYCGLPCKLRDVLYVAGGAGAPYIAKHGGAKLKSVFTRTPKAAGPAGMN